MINIKVEGLKYLLLIILSLTQLPSDAEVQDISNRKYYPAVLEEIQKAQQSIYLCMYYISYHAHRGEKVKALIESLSQAKERGVKVEVILDRGFEATQFEDMSKKNMRSYFHLKKKGIDVYYDDIETLTHAKYLVIDEKVVIAGSFNWSEKSLKENRECALLVRSEDLAKEYIQNFKMITRYSPGPVKGGIPIPREFIENKELASKMATRQDEDCFNFYLWLQKRSYETKSKTIQVSQKELLEIIYHGPKPKWRRGSVIQTFVNNSLRLWTQKYAFLVDYRRDKEKKETLIIELDKENNEAPDSLYLSKIFWEDKWYTRLKCRSLFSYIVTLDQTNSGRSGRIFSEGLWALSEKYNLGADAISAGFMELQKYNLVDKEINYIPGERNPNEYYLKKFYKMKDFEKKLEKIKEKTDKEVFKNAREILTITNQEYDIKELELVIQLGEKLTQENFRAVLEKIKGYTNTLSPYRSQKYVLAMLRNKIKESDGIGQKEDLSTGR